MLEGLLIKESLMDVGVLDGLQITQTETWQARNTTGAQPKVWTAVSFQVDDSQADRIAEALSRSLKPQGWYISGTAGDTVHVIYPQRVFTYRKGDGAQRQAAQAHGLTLGIPCRQLDWAE